MSICSRCGSDMCFSYSAGAGDARDVIACRDRELASLRSLLRSVTRRLENAREELEYDGDPAAVITARNIIDGVLEQLS